jgi:protein SFI1
VRAAEEHEGIHALPFRALFAAYNQVLTQRGISSANDRIYLRFLFRLGEVRQPGQSISEAFEAFLVQRGIFLEFSEDEDEIGTTKTKASEYEGEEEEEQEEDSEPTTPRRTRRASFSSFISYEEETNKEELSRPSSRASLSRIEDNTIKSPPRKSTINPQTARRDIERYIQDTREKDAWEKEELPPDRDAGLRNLLSARAEMRSQGSKSQKLQIAGSNGTQSVSRNGYAQTRRSVPSDGHRITPEELIAAASSMLQSSDNSLPAHQETDPTVTMDYDFQLSSHFPTEDAEDPHYHARYLVRNAFWKWRQVTQQRRVERLANERIADHYGDQWLATLVLRRWHDAARDRNAQAQETDRFYGKLERKAVRARNIYVLTKAFTHWAQCAAEEQEKLSLARRHIIRLRYFNAWKDITAVNEMKVRRFVLEKFFNVLKRRYAINLAYNERAIDSYQESLLSLGYYRWTNGFMQRRASEFYEAHLAQRTLVKWTHTAQKLWQRQVYVEGKHEDSLVRRALEKWVGRFRTNIQQESQAEQFHRRQLVANALPTWHLQLKHAPLARQIEGRVNWGIVTNALGKMKSHMQMKNRAEQFDRRRVMQIAFRAWNKELRYLTLRQQIDDRLVVQALYRWVLAERSNLLARLNEERSQQRVLDNFVARFMAKKVQTRQSHNNVMLLRKQKLKASVIQRWREKCRSRQEQVQQAVEHDNRAMLQLIMALWHVNHNHQTQMARWSTEAIFYLRTTHILKVWREAVSKQQKQKLKNSYASMRRIVKMNLAKRLLSTWQNKTTQVLVISHTADEVSANRLHHLALDLLPHWRARLAVNQSFVPAAIEHHTRTLISTTFRTWSARHTLQESQLLQSTSFAASAVERTAYDALRRLQLRALEVQQLTARATKIHEWNARRHARALFRLWASRADQKRSPSVPSPLPSAIRSTRSRRTADHGNTPTALSEISRTTTLVPDRLTDLMHTQSESSALLAQASGQKNDPNSGWIPSPSKPSSTEPRGTSTPAIGYLSTPSKRAARARALVNQGSYTPATAPRTAPRINVHALASGLDSGNLDTLEEAQDDIPPRQYETPLVRTLFRRTARAPATDSRLGFGRGQDPELELGRSLPAPGPLTASASAREARERERGDPNGIPGAEDGADDEHP